MPSNGYITARAYMSDALLPLQDVAVTFVAADNCQFSNLLLSPAHLPRVAHILTKT